eukprot:4083009-Pleurochrysis_carterae.AAC.1
MQVTTCLPSRVLPIRDDVRKECISAYVKCAAVHVSACARARACVRAGWCVRACVRVREWPQPGARLTLSVKAAGCLAEVYAPPSTAMASTATFIRQQA